MSFFKGNVNEVFNTLSNILNLPLLLDLENDLLDSLLFWPCLHEQDQRDVRRYLPLPYNHDRVVSEGILMGNVTISLPKKVGPLDIATTQDMKEWKQSFSTFLFKYEGVQREGKLPLCFSLFNV